MMMVNDANDVMLITTEGVIIRIHAEDINIIGRNTSGVRLMRTTETNLIVSCAKTDREDEDPEDSEAAEKPEISDGDEEGADLETLPETSDDAVEGPDTEAGRDILNKLDIE